MLVVFFFSFLLSICMAMENLAGSLYLGFFLLISCFILFIIAKVDRILLLHALENPDHIPCMLMPLVFTSFAY